MDILVEEGAPFSPSGVLRLRPLRERRAVIRVKRNDPAFCNVQDVKVLAEKVTVEHRNYDAGECSIPAVDAAAEKYLFTLSA
jgi:hypothetical protein